eukprot:CAMPEP_0174887286 /NCGR_PEP_ID=MMETSP0167-20121228/2540_1 /TAXON_ID=38298 /ORGANISM="Rhodella maculata, Strain CCMP736" /LENGTH=205 /DNA_ID=CAMNT_0016123701 /DNA_START=273 /DNA_END=891 /DNA_ORIENTATION=+
MEEEAETPPRNPPFADLSHATFLLLRILTLGKPPHDQHHHSGESRGHTFDHTSNSRAHLDAALPCAPRALEDFMQVHRGAEDHFDGFNAIPWPSVEVAENQIPTPESVDPVAKEISDGVWLSRAAFSKNRLRGHCDSQLQGVTVQQDGRLEGTWKANEEQVRNELLPAWNFKGFLGWLKERGHGDVWGENREKCWVSQDFAKDVH